MNHIIIRERDDLTEAQGDSLGALSEAVYPSEEDTEWAGATIEWAGSQWRALVVVGGEFVCHVGILSREAIWDERPVQIGGVGGVMTHPDARRRGHAGSAMAAAVDFLRDQQECHFGLLVCDSALIGYYESLGWRTFGGEMVTRQHGDTVPFTFNRPMVIDLVDAAPAQGTIDLLGPPW